MGKVKLTTFVTEARGAIGNVVFRTTRHGVVVTRKPQRVCRWSKAQREYRERMKSAGRFYKGEMADPEKRRHYVGRAAELNIPVSAFVIGGFMKHGPDFARLEAPRARVELAARDGVDPD